MTPASYVPPQPQSNLQVENLKPDGKPPKSRIPDAAKASAIFWQLREANRTRNEKQAKIKGMFDGNPPYSPSRLKNSGQLNRTNFNTLEAKATLSSALVPYYDLFTSARSFLEIPIETGNAEFDSRASRVVTEEVDRVLREWPDFQFKVHRMLHDFIAFGLGFLAWEDPVSWKFNRWTRDRVLFPDATDVDLDCTELFAVRRKFTVGELYGFIKDEKTAATTGWNKRAVEQAIWEAVPPDPQTYNDYMAVQQMLNDSDVYANSRLPLIECVFLYVKEFSGKWTQIVIAENKQPSDFLYRRLELYDDLTEILCPFVFEVQDDTWNGATGLGKDIYAPMQTKDRIRCSQVDALFMRNSLILQAKTASALQKAALVQLGAATVIPPDFAIQQGNVLADLESTVVINRDLDSMLQRNTGIYRPALEKSEGNPRTATEAQLEFSQSTILGNAAVNRFYQQLDRLYQEVTRRMFKNPSDKLAKKFIERIEARGIPKVNLKFVGRVQAARASGNGSPFLRMQSIGALAQFAPSFPEEGRINFLEDAVATLSTQAKVERYLPKPPEAQTPQDEQAYAILENAVLSQGAAAMRTGTQNDVVHLDTHFPAVASAAQSLQQGGNPAEVLRAFQAFGPHIAAHLQAVAQDPSLKPRVKEWTKQLEQLGKITDDLTKTLEQQAQNQQQVMNDQQLKQYETQAKLQLSGAKAQQQMQLKQAKAMQDMAIADAKTASDINRQNLLAASTVASETD